MNKQQKKAREEALRLAQTPRTDAEIQKIPRQIDLREWTYDEVVPVDTARTLERELNALRAECERLQGELHKAWDRCESLEADRDYWWHKQVWDKGG